MYSIILVKINTTHLHYIKIYTTFTCLIYNFVFNCYTLSAYMYVAKALFHKALATVHAQ